MSDLLDDDYFEQHGWRNDGLAGWSKVLPLKDCEGEIVELNAMDCAPEAEGYSIALWQRSVTGNKGILNDDHIVLTCLPAQLRVAQLEKLLEALVGE